MQFPLFSEAEYVETVVGPGECLYIPVLFFLMVRLMNSGDGGILLGAKVSALALVFGGNHYRRIFI